MPPNHGRRKFASLVLKIGGGLHQLGRQIRIGSCPCHLEQRGGGFAAVEVIVGHDMLVPVAIGPEIITPKRSAVQPKLYLLADRRRFTRELHLFHADQFLERLNFCD
jgi:hypothetical protein